VPALPAPEREIPRVFHQIWLGSDPLPRDYAAYQKTWTRRHPGWELRLWTEDDLPGDLERKEIYELLRRPAERSDMLRLELLHRHGGVYLDADFECRRSLEPLLEGVTFFCAYIDPGRVNNALIGSVAGHPLLERGIRELRPRTTFGPVDKEGTGPLFFNGLVSGQPGVTIFAEELFYPRTPAETEGAYAVHHAGRSWKEPADLLLDAVRAEQRLAIVQYELAKSEQRSRLAEAEAEALRSSAGARALALRTRRFFVRRVPRERIRYVLGTLRARALRRG
jgi:inositol phosphorylceramide mannosyltransferase catalytic subunit